MEPKPPTDRFQAANDIFGAALGLPSDQRARFVESRCSGDISLQQSVLRLLSKFDQIGDFLEEPASAFMEELRPGDMLADRFRIVRKVGAGGMGEVYQAEDQVLHEAVALKLMRPDFRENDEAEVRFCDEIRLARRISHPNVCRTFDVFSVSHEGVPLLFFTMAFLEGETLNARLHAQGPFSAAATLDIAAQIAAGLDAAHREGIIHRDLKPANIMLVPQREGGTPRAVITDFGLARPLDKAAAGVTQTGQLLGSPQYMAPEQFLGTHVTAAADIYTLGMIVFEMISGKRPFPDESLVRAAIRRTTDDAPLLSAVAPGAPAAWTGPVARALARNPAARPATAVELAGELEKPRAGFRLPSRRTLIYSAAGLGAVSASAGILRLYQWKAVRLPATPLIMFANASSPGPEGESTAAFMTLLERQLDPAHVSVLARDRVKGAWGRMHPDGAAMPDQLGPRDARELALRAGANLVAFTGATRKLDEWSFWLRVELLGSSPAAPASYWDREFKTSLAGDRFTASIHAAHWLRETVGASLPPNTRERSPQELTTSNWEALEEFARAERAWTAGNREAAVRHLKTALDLDADFPLAASRMADILTSSGRIDEGLTLYSRASELSRRKNLTDRESLRMRTLFSMDTGQYTAGEEAASRWANDYPEDGVALVHKATLLEGLGQPEAALHLLGIAIQRLPDSRAPLMRRAMVLLRLRQFDAALVDCDRLAKIPPVDSTWLLRGALAFARLDMSGAWSALEQMQRTGGATSQSSAYHFQACHRADQDRRDEAGRILQDGIRFDREHSFAAAELKKRRMLAQVAILIGDRSAAREQCRLVLAAKPGHAATMEIGCLLAQAGDLTGARECLRTGLPEWPIYTHWQGRLEGEIALASGNAAAALARMTSSPPDPSRGMAEWPAYLVRAAVAAGRSDIVRQSLGTLLTNPARYWFNADATGPGYLSWSLQSLGQWIDPDLGARASALRQALAVK